MYKFLTGKISEVFGTKPTVVLVDKPSIKVQRVTASGVTNDTFSYDVIFDLYLMQNKDLMTYLRNNDLTNFKEGWIIANAVVKNMTCTVTFVP